MEFQTISQISKNFNLSTRALRYYEQIGLIKSERKDNYAYRVYTEETVTRLKQIVLLRKLRIPLKQIAEILQSKDVAMLIDAFEKNLNEIDDEITALSTIRDIISNFIEQLNVNIHDNIELKLLEDSDLLEAVDSITIKQTPLKEEKTAENLQTANKTLNKLTDRNVRIIYLPPCTVASAHIHTEGAECITDDLLRNFAITNHLIDKKPDFRYFGFNHDVDGQHGYERWITIPDNMEVLPPLIKKEFKGGLYAAHMIPIGAFDEWQLIFDWANNNPKYEIVWGPSSQMNGFLEEHLNCYHNLLLPEGTDMDQIWQLDLLIPIQPKQ